MYVQTVFYSCLDVHSVICFFFFFNDTATTEIYTLSLHDALPIFTIAEAVATARDRWPGRLVEVECDGLDQVAEDRKSTRLNSSHTVISYAVFCLKKKKKKKMKHTVKRRKK